MGRIENTVWCDGCGIEIPLAPTKCKDYEFCCQGCAGGLPCWCGIFWFDDDDYEREAPSLWLSEREYADRRWCCPM